MNVIEFQQATHLGLDSNGMLMTPAQYDAIEDWDVGYTYELIHGVVIVNPIPSEAEADPNEELGYLLRDYQRNHPNGSVIDKTMSERYLYLENSRRRPDRVVWIELGRLPQPSEDVPVIVIEFVSQSQRDRHRDYVEKRQEYTALGIKEYWVIDRFDRTMTVFYGKDSLTNVRENDLYQTELLPGFELPLKQLFQVADDWKET